MLKTKISDVVKNHYFSSARNNKFKQKKMCLLMTEVNEEYLFSVFFIRIRLKQE